MNNIVFGQYYNSNSWLHRLDPRTKIISIIILIIGLFLLKDIIALSVAFGLTIALVLSTKIPFMKFLNSLKMMTTLLFITVVFQVLFNQGQMYKEIYFTLNVLNLIAIIILIGLFIISKKVIRKFRFFLFLFMLLIIFFIQTNIITQNIIQTPVIFQYNLRFYEQGLITSVIVLLRIITLVLISSLLTLTTKPTDLNNGLEAVMKPLKLIGVKVSILTMMISIALRFIPTLINEANKILKAQASRGVDFKEGKFKDKITQIISLLIPMFVISYKRAYDLADAMEARGYIPEAKRTSINLLKFRFADYFVFFLTFAILASAIFYRVYYYAI